MKKYLPYVLLGLGLVFIITSQVLRNGTQDADAAITNVAGSFMFFGGAVCCVVAIVSFFLRHDPEVW